MKLPAKYNRHKPVPEGVRADYWDLRATWIPDSLADLNGPSSGDLELPITIEWSTRRPIHFDDSRSIVSGYAAVLREARSDEDLHILNREVLTRVWSDLYLPGRIREAWVQRFPELEA
ncbi:hypothetical protein E3T61_03170 [Cryobacterium lactosi]|uniref:Uncharacterized protein n=1 Tax=Cryobacterium lactosi TaxID=1259202 RepID=A0A4R9BY33_9MICO|nr:hypothetical protein [Cryobacterium lactosi]TFD94013.1 hypothetical protein E3T61_03170 [Cryobacterium lactosi]